MKCFKKVTALFIVFCVFLNAFIFKGYSESDNGLITSTDFLKSAGALVNKYDTPVYIPESSEEFTFEESNRLILKTVSNDAITDDQGAIDKVEGWNSVHILQYESKEDMQAAVDFFSTQSFVEYVEEDRYIEIYPSSGENNLYSEEPLSWGNDVVKSTQVNDVLIKSNISLSEVIVGVFDTGLNINHEYFTNERILPGYNVFDQNTTITDVQGHGSHVTGIILNNTVSNVKIKMYKLNSVGVPSTKVAASLFATAIVSAVDEGIDVINMSLSLNISSNYIDDAIEYAYCNDVPIVVAAGNDKDGEGKNADETYLASKNTVLTVAAIDKSLTPMLKSKNGEVSTNYGASIDVAAPGENINSVNAISGFMESSGTSMAVPFVTAAVAILKSIDLSLTSNEIKSRITSSVFIPDGWDSNKYGSGILDCEQMISDMLTGRPKITVDSNIATISASLFSKIYYTTDGTDPVVGSSPLYNEPINISNFDKIKAVAYEEGKLPSIVVAYEKNRTKSLKMRYMGTEKLTLKQGEELGTVYIADEDIIVYNGDGKIKAHGVGKTQVIVFTGNNRRVTFNVTVDFEPWQILHRIFYEWFGILLWSF